MIACRLIFVFSLCLFLGSPYSTAFAKFYDISFDSSIVDAADRNKENEVLRLLKSGINANNRGAFRTTALMRAAYNGNMKIVELLVKNGADINAADIGGATALHIAARRNNVQIIDYLIKAGALYSLKDAEGFTPAERARAANNIKAAELIETYDQSIGLGTVPKLQLVQANDAPTKPTPPANTEDNVTKTETLPKHDIAHVNEEQLDSPKTEKENDKILLASNEVLEIKTTEKIPQSKILTIEKSEYPKVTIVENKTDDQKLDTQEKKAAPSKYKSEKLKPNSTEMVLGIIKSKVETTSGDQSIDEDKHNNKDGGADETAADDNPVILTKTTEDDILEMEMIEKALNQSPSPSQPKISQTQQVKMITPREVQSNLDNFSQQPTQTQPVTLQALTGYMVTLGGFDNENQMQSAANNVNNDKGFRKIKSTIDRGDAKTPLIHIGKFRTEDDAEKACERIKRKYNVPMCNIGPAVAFN